MVKSFDVLIIGGGHAGAQAAISLRQHKFSGSIGILNREAELPYERPPLSKGYLARDVSFDRILIRPAAFWEDRQINIIPGCDAISIDPQGKIVGLHDGDVIGYDQLIWAAGGVARELSCPGYAFDGVHTIRSRADADRIIDTLETTQRVAVIGGGYIGLEAAAVLRKLGREVVLFEAQSRLLARVSGETVSRFYDEEHRARGVDVRLCTTIERIEGSHGGKVVGVRLSSGELVPVQMIIVGIGILPEIGPLVSAGAEGGNGVVVDENGRTSLPGIFAIGDCAASPNTFAGGAPVRIESVQNAHEMAGIAARTIVGESRRDRAVPWFWSDQYDLRLQTAGLLAGYDQEVVRGDQSARAFSVFYLRRGQVIAVDCVNSAKDFVQGRELIAASAVVSSDLLGDRAISLKALIAES